jgi:hypothetical protein
MINSRCQEAKPQIEDDVAEGGAHFIASKAGDKFCTVSIALGALYVLWLIAQAVHYWLVVGK